MSFKPIFAYQVVRGVKKLELRKKVFNIERDSRVLVYASKPIKAIVGEFKVGRVIEGKVRDIWEYAKRVPDSGVDERDLPYIEGGRRILAIEVLNPIEYRKIITINDIRIVIPKWRPPRSYTKVRERFRSILEELIDAHR